MSETANRVINIIVDHILVCEERFKSINSPEDFVSTTEGGIRLDAIAIRLQSVGENIKRLIRMQPELKTKTTNIDWDAIVRLRDFISHHYESLDHELIFNICKIHLVPLKEKLMRELSEENS